LNHSGGNDKNDNVAIVIRLSTEQVNLDSRVATPGNDMEKRELSGGDKTGNGSPSLRQAMTYTIKAGSELKDGGSQTVRGYLLFVVATNHGNGLSEQVRQ